MIVVKPVVKRFLLFKGKLLKLIFSDFPLDDFSLHFFSIRAVTKILHIWWFKWTFGVFIELFFNQMNTSQSRFIVLPLNHSWLVLLVHALNSLTSIALKILVTRLYRVFDINDFLFSEVFKIHIFGTIDFLLIFIDLNLHFIDKADSDWV